jgi:hypothetical protein
VSSPQNESSARDGDPAAGPETGQSAPPAPATQPPGARTRWKVAKDGGTVFRRGTPVVAWWAWVIFAAYGTIQVIVTDHDYFSVELTAGLLAVTAIVYACSLRPSVIANDEAVYVCNPYRDHRVGWGGLNGVYLGDSVELSCARHAPQKDKTIYCWALYSTRRARLRAEMRAERNRRLGSAARRAPVEADRLARQDEVQLMAAELGRRSTDAKLRGAPADVLQSTWARLPLACLLLPAAALVGLLLAG